MGQAKMDPLFEGREYAHSSTGLCPSGEIEQVPRYAEDLIFKFQSGGGSASCFRRSTSILEFVMIILAVFALVSLPATLDLGFISVLILLVVAVALFFFLPPTGSRIFLDVESNGLWVMTPKSLLKTETVKYDLSRIKHASLVEGGDVFGMHGYVDLIDTNNNRDSFVVDGKNRAKDIAKYLEDLVKSHRRRR